MHCGHMLRKLILGLAVVALCSCQAPTQHKHAIVTEYGLGLDKWATAWLMSRHAERDAPLNVVDFGQTLPEGIAFDVPTSPLKRERDHAAFQSVMGHYRLEDPALQRMSQIVRDIEVNYWGSPDAAESPAIEQAFRALQQRHGRYAVTPECYLAFFDRVHAYVMADPEAGDAVDPARFAVDCHALASEQSEGALVPELGIGTLLSEMRAGKTVAFVDVREPEEYAEAHIPAAYNMPLRALDATALAKLRGVDYVVSYCIKDFRGFEMARSLRDAGIRNAVILNPYGIKGWIEEGLPTVGEKALVAEAGRRRMDVCVASPDRCKADRKAKQAGTK